MFRNTIARRLTSLACLCAMLAYSAWSFTATVANPEMSDELARSLLARPAIASALVGGAASHVDALHRAGVDPDAIEAITSTVLEDPRVVDAIAGAVSGMHHDLVDGSQTVRVEIPGETLTLAARDAAVAHGVDPAMIPELSSPSLAVPSTTTLGSLNRAAQRWDDGLRIAFAVLALALLVANDRVMITRRVGRWMVLSSGVGLVGSLLAMWLTHSSNSTMLAAAGGVAGVWRSRTQPVLIVVLIAGICVWTLSSAVMNGSFGVAVAARLGGRGAPLTEMGTRSSSVPRIDARGNPVPGATPVEHDHHSTGLSEFDPWLDGTVRGGRNTASQHI